MYYYFNVWKAYTEGVLLLESEEIIHMKFTKIYLYSKQSSNDFVLATILPREVHLHPELTLWDNLWRNKEKIIKEVNTLTTTW